MGMRNDTAGSNGIHRGCPALSGQQVAARSREAPQESCDDFPRESEYSELLDCGLQVNKNLFTVWLLAKLYFQSSRGHTILQPDPGHHCCQLPTACSFTKIAQHTLAGVLPSQRGEEEQRKLGNSRKQETEESRRDPEHLPPAHLITCQSNKCD